MNLSSDSESNFNGRYLPCFTTPVLPNQPHLIYGDSHIKRYSLLTNFNKSEISSEIPIAYISSNSIASSGSLSNGSSKMKREFPELELFSENFEDESLRKNLCILCETSKSGDLDKFKDTYKFLKQHAKGNVNINSFPFPLGSTPIHIAAFEGNFCIVEYIISEKLIEIDARDSNLETPLMKCCKYGHFQIAQLLINHGAKVNEVDSQGWTALHNASANGHLKIVSLLVEEGKALVNSQNCRGFTPLMDASARGFPDVAKYLVSQRYLPCDPTLENRLGETAYAIAACCENVFLCDILEEAEILFLSKNSISSYRKRQKARLISVYENERYVSPGKLKALWSFSKRFSPAHLVDGYPHFTYRGTQEEAQFSSVSLPAEDDSNWFWQTDWKLCNNIPRVDVVTGWQYSKSFDSHDSCWTAVAPTKPDNYVRRRRWYRVAQKTMQLT